MKKLFLSLTALALFSCSSEMALAGICMRHDGMATFLASKDFLASLKVRGEGVNTKGEPMMMEIYANDTGDYFTVHTTKQGVSCLVSSGDKFTLYEDKGI